MASNLTSWGREVMLKGNGSTGSFARLATKLKLYAAGSAPNIDGTGFTELADNGNGYTTGGKTLAIGNWNFDGVNKLLLDEATPGDGSLTWTATGPVPASGGAIAGAYITDASGAVLAWLERGSTLSLTAGDTTTVDGFSIQIG